MAGAMVEAAQVSAPPRCRSFLQVPVHGEASPARGLPYPRHGGDCSADREAPDAGLAGEHHRGPRRHHLVGHAPSLSALPGSAGNSRSSGPALGCHDDRLGQLRGRVPRTASGPAVPAPAANLHCRGSPGPPMMASKASTIGSSGGHRLRASSIFAITGKPDPTSVHDLVGLILMSSGERTKDSAIRSTPEGQRENRRSSVSFSDIAVPRPPRWAAKTPLWLVEPGPPSPPGTDVGAANDDRLDAGTATLPSSISKRSPAAPRRQLPVVQRPLAVPTTSSTVITTVSPLPPLHGPPRPGPEPESRALHSARDSHRPAGTSYVRRPGRTGRPALVRLLHSCVPWRKLSRATSHVWRPPCRLFVPGGGCGAHVYKRSLRGRVHGSFRLVLFHKWAGSPVRLV